MKVNERKLKVLAEKLEQIHQQQMQLIHRVNHLLPYIEFYSGPGGCRNDKNWPGDPIRLVFDTVLPNLNINVVSSFM